MAVASWMLRNRNRSSRFNRKVDNDEYNVKLDLSINPNENIKDMLTNICQHTGISEGKRLNYLNAFVKLTLHINGNFIEYGYSVEEILCCLRVSLVNDSTQVRSGGFRAIRHVLKSEEDIIQFNNLRIPFLIARSLDLALKNDVERMEALKLIRKVLMLSPSDFDIAIARSLVSLANGGFEEKDRMLRVCLGTLSELGTLNPDLFIVSGGVAALTRNLMECQTPKIAEALCGVLLLLLDKPETRNQAGVYLHCVAAPYCDFHYRHGWMDKNRDERELRFNCSRLALLTILRSWPGILHFCSPANLSGLRAIVDVLYLDQLEVRKAVLDLLYELLGMPQPEWTDELFVALSAVDPSEPQASWRLNEGFVAAEGRSILPHLAKTVPSISDMHLSLLLYCFLENGLLGALSEVIATSDTFISVRATVLLGELLRLIQILLPPECCNITPPLPNLLEYATTKSPQALRAITALQQQHKLLKKRPASYSLYLDFILQCGCFMKSSSKVDKAKKHKFSGAKAKLQQLVSKDDAIIRETGVLLNKDAFTWNWNLIRVIIKGENELSLDMNEVSHRSFLKRLVEFYMPSKNRYSHLDLTTPKTTQGYTIVGIEIIRLLVETDCSESIKLLKNLFTDISNHIAAITLGKSAHDCLFSPQHMANTQCQTYFLFIGRLGSSREGVKVLVELNIFKQLESLATTTNHDCYVKLIISSLDYREPGPARDLLSAVLTCPIENSRLYATQFLLILLRAGIPHFANWGIKMLAVQLRDKSRPVYLSALCTLQEACEIPMCLEHLVKLNPELLHLGEKGVMLLIRFLSTTTGFSILNKNNFVVNEIARWDNLLNYRYVKIVEGDTSDVLTLHQRGEDGRYDKRNSSTRVANRKDLFLPPHIYGQLSKNSVGFETLLEHGSIDLFIHTIEMGLCDTDADILKLKAAIWALGHFGSSTKGAELLNSRGAIAATVSLAQTSAVFAVRATAYYSLGLLATTRTGADCLFKLGWVCTRHDRHDRWPIIEEENWEEGKMEDGLHGLQIGSDSERTSSDQPFVGDFGFMIAEDSATDDELIYIESGASVPQQNQKSLTLPASQTPSAGYHKRSLSESKTFEMIKTKNADVLQRHRNNSTTESTTSGVSSCESVLGKASVLNDRVQTLSPIPSSSSLSTLRQTGVKLRRHSESSKRVSSQSSDRSTVSPAGSWIGKLSYQDRIGYATVRSIRRQYPGEDLTDILHGSISSKSYIVYIKARQFLDQDGDILESSITSGPSLTSLSSIQKFSVKDSVKNTGQCYMGICLPQVLTDLFPRSGFKQAMNFPFRNQPGDDTLMEYSSDSSLMNLEVSDKRRFFRHDPLTCLNCCRVREKNIKKEEMGAVNKKDLSVVETDVLSERTDDAIKRDILLQIEHLSNPLWTKQATHALLHHKQRNPQIFQDVCLYSDMCKLLSECTYRLGPRRVLHELFFDVRFDSFYIEPQAIISKDRETVNHQPPESNQSSTGKSKFLQTPNEQRKTELLGLKKEPQGADCAERFSPTRYEPRSPPPLSSVKEEMASNENLLGSDSEQLLMHNKGEEAAFSNIKTLDQLHLTYKENKFPIKTRSDS